MRLRKILIFLILIGFLEPVWAERIKDITTIKGVRSNQLVGYGLVVGLDGTGDGSKALFTTQSIVTMLENMGMTIDSKTIRVENVAAVMVTADMPAYVSVGNHIDVIVSSLGDATNLSEVDLCVSLLSKYPAHEFEKAARDQVAADRAKGHRFSGIREQVAWPKRKILNYLRGKEGRLSVIEEGEGLLKEVDWDFLYRIESGANVQGFPELG